MRSGGWIREPILSDSRSRDSGYRLPIRTGGTGCLPRRFPLDWGGTSRRPRLAEIALKLPRVEIASAALAFVGTSTTSVTAVRRIPSVFFMIFSPFACEYEDDAL
jgi:hypothetical protein